MSETLRESADAEARKAEKDFAKLGAKEKTKVARERAQKPNGKANGVGAGSLTSDEGAKDAQAPAEKAADKAPRIWDRAPSQEEIAHAAAVFQGLKERAQELGAEAVVDALLQVVDIHPTLKTPGAWPGKADAELHPAPPVAEIVEVLCRGCQKIEIAPREVIALWRNKAKWTRRQVAVRADARPLGPVASFLGKGAAAALLVNYQVFKLLNTQQKVAAIYHELRKLGKEGGVRPNQFEGFYDEIELFGTGTWQTDEALVHAISVAAERSLPFAGQRSLFEEDEGTGGEED